MKNEMTLDLAVKIANNLDTVTDVRVLSKARKVLLDNLIARGVPFDEYWTSMSEISMKLDALRYEARRKRQLES